MMYSVYSPADRATPNPVTACKSQIVAVAAIKKMDKSMNKFGELRSCNKILVTYTPTTFR